MITLITGAPGSGKSLYTVAELVAPMIGAVVEDDAGKHDRHVFTNIKNLVLEHELIGPDNLNTWTEWVKPGDFVVYDEVQEVWRPRAMGTKVPESIQALEVHRHRGVDFVLITQHPMLLDQNIRRLVGRHLHVRRIANMALAVVYEWDHAANPSSFRNAIATRPWRYPKSAYKLYKSAELHTKQKRKVPGAVFVLGAAFVGLAWMAPTVYGRLNERFTSQPVAKSHERPKSLPAGVSVAQAASPSAYPASPASAPSKDSGRPLEAMQLGCIHMPPRCSCFDAGGALLAVEPKTCEEGSHRLGYVIPSHGRQGAAATAVASLRPPADISKLQPTYVPQPEEQGSAKPIIIGGSAPAPAPARKG